MRLKTVLRAFQRGHLALRGSQGAADVLDDALLLPLGILFGLQLASEVASVLLLPCQLVAMLHIFGPARSAGAEVDVEA